MDTQQQLESNGEPQTYRQIMFQALSPRANPQRRKITDEDDLKQLGLTPNELVEMLARALATKNGGVTHDSDTDTAVPDIDTRLKRQTVVRILTDKKILPGLIRDELAKGRQHTIENIAREALRAKTTLDDPYTPDEAVAAITKISWKDRNDLAGSFGRTSNECAEVLTERARALLDREFGSQAQVLPAMPEDEARQRGLERHDMFNRAVEPCIKDAEIAPVVGQALAALPSLKRDLGAPQALAKQLASRALLLAGQTQQLDAETSARRHFPFGLQRPTSLAVVAAAIYLIRAQCSDTIVRAAQHQYGSLPNPEKSFTTARNELGSAVWKGEEANEESNKPWIIQYGTTPGALDCLRVASSVLSNENVPAFLNMPQHPHLPHTGVDPAHKLVHAALPLDEQPKGSRKPWTQTGWNPFGQQLLHEVNQEHYKQGKHPLFNEEEFEFVASQHTTDVLTELIKRLQRVEGRAAGFTNIRKTYAHISVLSLNRFLFKISKTGFPRRFVKYRADLGKLVYGVRDGTDAPARDWTTSQSNDLPKAVKFLALDSVRATMNEMLAQIDKKQWDYTDLNSDPAVLSAMNVRGAAIEMLEVANWAEANEAHLNDLSLNEILTAYHIQHEELGNPPTEPEDADFLRDQIVNAVLSDSAVVHLLEDLDARFTESAELSKDTDHDH